MTEPTPEHHRIDADIHAASRPQAPAPGRGLNDDFIMALRLYSRLPTGAEWETAAAGAPLAGNFLESRALHPLAPREAWIEGTLAQAFGDVWEWTRTDYGPYPGFSPAAGAVGDP